MIVINVKGSKPEQVLIVLQRLPKDQVITVVYWNGTTTNNKVSYHISELRGIISESAAMGWVFEG